MLVIASLLLVILNIVDLVLSRKILDNGGRELNPFMRNPKLWIPIKVASSLICIVLAACTSWIVLIIPNLMMIGACVWNYRQLRKLRD